MELKVIREKFTDNSVTGRLLINGLFYCFTLEDRDRYLEKDAELKVAGASAIPIGRYEVVVNYSPRFQRNLPLLLNVPGFEGVRIHSGNTPEDTEGCILLGKTRDVDYVGQSRAAFNEVFEAIQTALGRNEAVFISIVRLGEDTSDDIED